MKARRIAYAAVGVLMAGGIATALPGSAATPASAACTPRVTGLSYVLDVFETGAAVGPGITYGVALTALGTPLPGPLGTAQQTLLAAGATGVVTISQKGPAYIEQVRSAISMLATFDAEANMGIAMGANLVDGTATQFSTAIQPFDMTLHQMATIMRGAEETNPGC